MLNQVFVIYLLTLLATLYLLRGMLEIRETGWRGEALLTVFIGVGVLPVMAGLAATDIAWASWVILVASALGVLVNGVLLARLWKGLTPVAITTIAIIALYGAVAALALRL